MHGNPDSVVGNHSHFYAGAGGLFPLGKYFFD